MGLPTCHKLMKVFGRHITIRLILRVDGGLPVEDLADLISEELPEGDWNTVAGLVMGILILPMINLT